MEKNTADYFSKNAPEILDQDMTRGDIIAILSRLKFDPAGFHTIKLDGAVRDFGVGAKTQDLTCCTAAPARPLASHVTCLTVPSPSMMTSRRCDDRSHPTSAPCFSSGVAARLGPHFTAGDFDEAIRLALKGLI